MEKYILPDLPYAYDALEPYISKEIMVLHHDKHHATYVNNLNSAIEKHSELFEKSAEDLLMNLQSIPEDIRVAVRNNGGGHFNHSLFWQLMSPNSKKLPFGKLADAINKQFGSFVNFQQKFNDEGLRRFGSGWVWLILNKENALQVISTANQDNPISDGYKVIIGNDVWEHAYYLQYKNARADYLKAWWDVINWEEAEKRFVK